MSDQKILVKYGDNSEAVRSMQLALEILGYDPIYIDGDFRELTLKALNAFQVAKTLDVKNYFSMYELMVMLDISELLLREMLDILITKNI